MKNKVVFVGGHHNSALVVAQELKKRGDDIYWLGHKFNFRDKSLSAEFQEVTAEKIPFFELKTGRFYRQYNPIEHLKTIIGFIQAFAYLIKIHPDLIVSFGGFLAVPVVIAGWCLGVPSVTHEQTVVAGWANKAITPFVNKILLTHKSSLPNFPTKKTIVVGLPLRPELFDEKFKRMFSPPLLYISCGKQGSHMINQALFPLVPELVKEFTVVHQTGTTSLNREIDKARRIKESLGQLSDRYFYAPYFFSKDAATYLQSADIVVSRAGAHLTYELSMLHKKVVYIPITMVSHNEQLLNAKNAVKKTTSLILLEKDLNSESLMSSIKRLVKVKAKEPNRFDSKAGFSASTKMISVIDEILK